MLESRATPRTLGESLFFRLTLFFLSQLDRDAAGTTHIPSSLPSRSPGWSE